MRDLFASLTVAEQARLCVALALGAVLLLGMVTPVRTRRPKPPSPVVRLHRPDLPWRLEGARRPRDPRGR